MTRPPASAQPGAIRVRCFRNKKDREADPISDSLISANDIAVARGKRFLDDPEQGAYYHTVRRSLKIPHKGGGVVPGAWIRITDTKTGLNGLLLKVISYKLSVSRSSLWAVIETEEYKERL